MGTYARTVWKFHRHPSVIAPGPGGRMRIPGRPPGDRPDAQARIHAGGDMTLIWFVVWFVANNVGGHEPLVLDPVNVWAGFLLLAVALDLSAAHASKGMRR